MSVATDIAKSIAPHRVLVEIDIGQNNVQWFNIGAGIYEVNANNIYAYVDSTLMPDTFSAQDFGAIGSVKSDGVSLKKVTSLGAVTTNPNSFYYDISIRSLYVTLPNYDNPELHTVAIGVIYSYSDSSFIPVNGPGYYDGRLANYPTVSKRRDPLFYGRLSFSASDIELHNGDGEFDTFGEDRDIYGNPARILIGTDTADYGDFLRLFTGYVTRFNVTETSARFTIADTRKQLTKPIQYTCTDLNALDAIVEILEEAYGFNYNDSQFDTTAWAAATALAPNVTINMQEEEPVIDVIEDICAAVFGLFSDDRDGRFTFKVVDEDATAVSAITVDEILNPVSVRYDPSEVVSSVRIGYARDWVTTGNQYTYYTDTTRQASVFGVYKTYNQRDFETMLPDLSAATVFATAVLDRSDTVKGQAELSVPIQYYSVNVGEMITAYIDRENATALGSKTCEVISTKIRTGPVGVDLGVRIVA